MPTYANVDPTTKIVRKILPADPYMVNGEPQNPQIKEVPAGTLAGDYTSDYVSYSRPTNGDKICDEACRDAIWNRALPAIPALSWDNMTTAQRKVAMGQKDQLTPQDWDALYTSHPE